jgi:ABC-type glycerol-3-phosphate transport system substrate-binding protein
MTIKRLANGIIFLSMLLCCTGCQRKAEIVTKEKDTIVLTVLAGQSTSDAGIEDMIDEWMKEKYPGVRLDWECVDWGERFDAQLRSRFSAGDVPDIIVGKAQDVRAYVGTGNLAPVPESCSDMIKQEALNAVTVNGIVYGLPFNAWYQGVIFSKEIFQAYGIQIPQTLSQLEEAVDVIRAHGRTPFASHFRETWYLGNTTMQFMMNEVFCNTPNWGDQYRAGKVNFSDSQSIRRCVENNKNILNNSWEDALNIDQYESDNRFTNGEAVMYLTGSWSLQFANQYNSRDEFGIFPYPNEKGDAKLLRETNLTFMKSAHTLYDELITEIFEGIFSDRQLQGEILDYTQTQSVVKGFVPAYKSCIQDDIDNYEQEGQVLDVTAGNSQLVWSFQNSIAEEQLLWLKGGEQLEDFLRFTDLHRRESMNE